MSSGNERPRPLLAPEMTVSDASAACEYYAKYMGATILAKYPTSDGRLMHAELQLPNGSIVYLKDDFPEMSQFGSDLATDGKAHSSCCVALYFDNYDKAQSFWNTFHCSGNTSDVEIHSNFEPKFWGDNYGRFRCKFGHIWSLSAPLAPNQNVPPRPSQSSASNQNESNHSSSSSNNSNNSNKDANEGKNDEPPKKKQKGGNEENALQSGFKTVLQNVSGQYGLFMEFENVGMVASADMSKINKLKVEAAGEAYGNIWGFVASNFKDGNPTTCAVAVVGNDAQLKDIDSCAPGFLFDATKVSKDELEKKLNSATGVSGIVLKSLPASDWYVYLSIGSYDKLPQAWMKAKNDLEKRGYKVRDADSVAYEMYLNEPSQTKESDLQTELHIAVVKK